MTKVAFLADVHVGNPKRLGGNAAGGMNDRCRMTIDALRRACWEAKERGCARLYVLGDLFDGVSPGPRVVSAVQDVLSESGLRGVPVVVMPGNHDAVSSEPGDHALGPLRPVATVVDAPTIDAIGDVHVALVPHRAGHAPTWLPGVVSEMLGEGSDRGRRTPSSASLEPFRVLALHLGLSSDSAPPHLRADPSSVGLALLGSLASTFGVDLVVAGHWHPFAAMALPGGARAVQVGALAPTGWSDAGVADRGRLLVVSRSSVEAVEVPGPRFVRVKGPTAVRDIKAAAAAVPSGSSLFVDWTVRADDVRDARDDLSILVDRGVVFRGTVTVDVEDAAVDAREAAASVRVSDSLSGALEVYVSKLKLPDGVDRGRVLELTKRFTGVA